MKYTEAQYEDFLEYAKQLSKAYRCRVICEPILNNPLIWKTSGSGSPEKHHYGDYGLAVHTKEVIGLSLLAAKIYPAVDKGELFLSALFHDVGKYWDYERREDGSWTHSAHARNIHHISRSCWVWRDCAKDHVSEEVLDRISHNILAHHGCRQWGSPISPNTKEAFILHHSDSISARVADNQNGKDHIPST